jgi:hypothetical protein
MNLAIVVALGLCGQPIDTFTGDDTLDQWEHGLLESKWAYADRATGAPRILLVMKYWPVDHRVFQLMIRNPWEGEPTPRLEIWTGTYKMMSRRLPGSQLSDQDMMQLVRLSFEQHWVPEERGHFWPPVQEYPLRLPYDGPNHGRLSPLTLAGALEAEGRIHWTEEISYIDWKEHRDFKQFFAELVFDAPFIRKDYVATSENMKFFLRSDSVKKIGWWKIGTDYTFSAVKKRHQGALHGETITEKMFTDLR